MYQRVMSLQRFGSGSRWPVWSLHGFTSLSFSKNLPLLLFHLFSPSRKIPPRNHRRSKHQEGGKVGRIQRAGENRVMKFLRVSRLVLFPHPFPSVQKFTPFSQTLARYCILNTTEVQINLNSTVANYLTNSKNLTFLTPNPSLDILCYLRKDPLAQ